MVITYCYHNNLLILILLQEFVSNISSPKNIEYIDNIIVVGVESCPLLFMIVYRKMTFAIILRI